MMNNIFQRKLKEAYAKGYRDGRLSKVVESKRRFVENYSDDDDLEQLTAQDIVKLCDVGEALAEELRVALRKIKPRGFFKKARWGVGKCYEPSENDPSYTIYTECRGVDPEDTIGVGSTIRLSFFPDRKLKILADSDCGSATMVRDYDTEGFQSIVDFVVFDIDDWYEENEEEEDW